MSSSKKPVSRRQAFRDAPTDPDPLKRTVTEIPLDAKAPGRSIEDEIQRQIAMQIAKKKSGASS